MPEGHTVHRIALQFTADFVGRRIEVTSPQGRFAAGAALLDGATMTTARAVGKHLFLSFARELPASAGAGQGETAEERWLRVHLGLYGAWDFHGRITPIGAGVASSMGAPRVRRAVRIGEGEQPIRSADADDDGPWTAPEPVGQVRVRLLTDECLADLRGPIACEVLTVDEVAAVVAQAGPDPRVDDGRDREDDFVRRLTSRGSPVGLLLMDQSVVSGIGNIYRAEMLFRAGLDPHVPGRRVPDEVARDLWRDWVHLLDDGVRTGAMVTRADLDDAGRELALGSPEHRHAVYGRAGEPCLVCGTPIALEELAGRKLYWCPTCQV